MAQTSGRFEVVRVPSRLLLAAVWAFMAVPLAGFEVILAERAPWWKLPYGSIQTGSAISAVGFAPLLYWTLRGRRWALPAMAAVSVIWCCGTVWTAFRDSNSTLGFFALGLMAFWTIAWSWLRHETEKPFFNPRLQWFQGAPTAIPALSCTLGETALRVSRIDRSGVFIFCGEGASASGLEELRRGDPVEMKFEFRDRQLVCRGLPVGLIRSGGRTQGLGFQFEGMTPDANKDLGDFVETLRGEGYV